MNRSGVRFPQVAPCDESRHGLHLSRVIGYRSPRPSAGVFLLVVPVVAVGVDGVAPDQNLIRAEGVPIWAARRRAGDPLAVRRLHQLIQHNYKPVPRPARASMANSAVVARSHKWVSEPPGPDCLQGGVGHRSRDLGRFCSCRRRRLSHGLRNSL